MSARVLARVATLVAGSPKAARASMRATTASVRCSIFSATCGARARGTQDVAITIYDSRGVARAWAGRPSDLAAERISGPPRFLRHPVARSGFVCIHHPMLGRPARRVGAVAAENILSPDAGGARA